MLEKIQNLFSNYRPDSAGTKSLSPQYRAAVLVPLYVVDEEMGIVLIRRSDEIGLHRGQMGFPGGMVDPGDNGDLRGTALREAEEELRIDPAHVRIMGKMSDRNTVVSGILVTPFVGIIPFPYNFTPDPGEIQGVHTTGLNALIRTSKKAEGAFDLPPPVYLLDGQPVWGLTARIITDLTGVLRPVL